MTGSPSAGPGAGPGAGDAAGGSQPRPAPPEHRPLAVLLVGAGLSHVLVPRFYDELVPDWLPGPARLWTVASGIAEVGCGLAVASRRGRRAGAWSAAALFVAVFPANLHLAWRWRRRSWPWRTVALGRLPLQAPLVAWAVRVARSEPEVTGAG